MRQARHNRLAQGLERKKQQSLGAQSGSCRPSEARFAVLRKRAFHVLRPSFWVLEDVETIGLADRFWAFVPAGHRLYRGPVQPSWFASVGAARTAHNSASARNDNYRCFPLATQVSGIVCTVVLVNETVKLSGFGAQPGTRIVTW